MTTEFGNRMRRYRLDRRWSQQELSLRAGVSTPHISSIERGYRHPSLDYAQRIADALGVPLYALNDNEMDYHPPKLRSSTEDLPLFLQSFILNESATQYLHVAHRMSMLPKPDADLLTLMVDLLVQKRKSEFPSPASSAPVTD